MIFDSAKDKCLFRILKILEKKKSSYSTLFKETKVSHITLQNTLKELLTKEFISKEDKGTYTISEKGRKLLKKLSELEGILE